MDNEVLEVRGSADHLGHVIIYPTDTGIYKASLVVQWLRVCLTAQGTEV